MSENNYEDYTSNNQEALIIEGEANQHTTIVETEKVIIGAIKIKDGLFIGDNYVAEVFF